MMTWKLSKNQPGKREKVQRRILRAIVFTNKYDSTGYMFEKKKILTVFELDEMELHEECKRL